MGYLTKLFHISFIFAASLIFICIDFHKTNLFGDEVLLGCQSSKLYGAHHPKKKNSPLISTCQVNRINCLLFLGSSFVHLRNLSSILTWSCTLDNIFIFLL